MGHRTQHATEIVDIETCSGPWRQVFMTPEQAAAHRALARRPKTTRPAGEEEDESAGRG